MSAYLHCSLFYRFFHWLSSFLSEQLSQCVVLLSCFYVPLSSLCWYRCYFFCLCWVCLISVSSVFVIQPFSRQMSLLYDPCLPGMARLGHVKRRIRLIIHVGCTDPRVSEPLSRMPTINRGKWTVKNNLL